MGSSADYPRGNMGVQQMSLKMQKAVVTNARKRMQEHHNKELAKLDQSLSKLLKTARNKDWHSDISTRLQNIRKSLKKSRKVRFKL